MRAVLDVLGPLQTFAGMAIAAARRHQTGHSCIAQHLRRVKVSRADEKAIRPVNPINTGKEAGQEFLGILPAAIGSIEKDGPGGIIAAP